MITLPPIKIAQGEPFAYSARVTGQSWVGYSGQVVFRLRRRTQRTRFNWNGYGYLSQTDPIVTATVTGDATGLMQFNLTAEQTLLFPSLPRIGAYVTAQFEITMGNGTIAKKYQGNVAVSEALDTVIQPGDGGGVVVPPVDQPVSAAVNTVAPVMTGSGKIGSAHTITSGTWTDAVSFQYRWQRNGVTIAGANTTSYTPVAADDLTTLTGQVAGLSAVGELSAYVSSNGAAITYEAPIAAGGISDVSWTRNTAIASISTAPRFTGSGLVYTYAPAVPGITINATSGLISGTPTTVAVATLITVTATNSGGAATRTFNATVTDTVGTPPTISNIAFSANQVTFDLIEASSYPVTVYYAVESNATAITGQALDDLVAAGTSPVEGTMNITAAGVATVSPNWAGMTTGASWYFKVAARNADGFITASSLVYGPFDWDAVAPVLVSSTPADDATGISVGTNVTLTFDKALVAKTGNIVLRQNIASVWSDAEAFDVVAEAGTGEGQVSVSGSTVTLNPSGALVALRQYAIRVPSTAIGNASGIAYAGIADDTTLSFTTSAGASFTYDAMKGSGTALATDLTVSLSGITAGQYLLAVLSTRGTAAVTTPSGWTLANTFAPESTPGTQFLVYTKTAAGGESSILFASTVFAGMVAEVIAFNGSGQIGTVHAKTSFAFSTSIVATGVAISEQAYRISIWGADADSVTITPPAGGTVLRNVGTRDGHLLWIEGPLAASAAVDKTATYDVANFYNACTLELEPL